MQASMQKPLAYSNDLDSLYNKLTEQLIAANRPFIEFLMLHMQGVDNKALEADLCSQARIAREMHVTRGYINQLVNSGKVKLYTDERLVRRSEVRQYIEDSRNRLSHTRDRA